MNFRVVVILLKSLEDLSFDLSLHAIPHYTLVDQETDCHEDDQQDNRQGDDPSSRRCEWNKVLRKLLTGFAVVW